MSDKKMKKRMVDLVQSNLKGIRDLKKEMVRTEKILAGMPDDMVTDDLYEAINKGTRMMEAMDHSFTDMLADLKKFNIRDVSFTNTFDHHISRSIKFWHK